MTDDESGSDNRIQAVENAFDIVEVVQAANGCDAVHVRRELDLPRSTAYIYLKTLEDLGCLTRRGDEYHVGVRFLNHGGFARDDIDVFRVARQEVEKVADETDLVATVGCEDDGLRVLLYLTESDEAVSDNPPTGEYTEMHWTALGKALLAEKTDDEVRAVVEHHGLPRATENTRTDIDSLLEDLDAVRERGYAVGDEERSLGVKSVGTTVDVVDDRYGPLAIAVAGPTSKLSPDRVEDEIVPVLWEAANVVELRMEHY
mgnify:CR=1 FL=1